MSLPRPRREGRPLMGGAYLIAMGVVFVGLALSIHPDLLGVRSWTSPGAPDPVSLAYLGLEVERRPNDAALRRAYVRQLLAAGRLEPAADAARPLTEEPVEVEAFLLVLEVELARMRDATGRERGLREEALAGWVKRGLPLSLEREERERLVAAAVEARRPALAAAHLDALGARQRAAQRYEEAGERELAAQRWLEVGRLELAGGRDRSRLARAVDALIRLDRGQDALDLTERWLARDPGAPEALDRGVRLAWAAGQLDLAFSRSAALLERRPDDPAALSAHIEIALARGQPADGLAAARQLSAVRPGSRSARVLRARVAEWSGEPDEALRIWWGLAQAGDRAAEEEAERIARGIGDEPVLLELVAARVERGQPDPDLVEQLVYLAEAVGDPERARRALVGRRGPRRLLVLRARLERQMGFDREAVASWDRAEALGPLSADEQRERTELVWRTLGAAEALERVVAQPDARWTEVADLVAELAWQAGDRALAERALRQRGQSLTPTERVRLMELLLVRGAVAEAVELGRAGLARAPDRDLLLRTLALAVAAGRPDWTRGLFGGEAHDSASEVPAYWRLRAELATLDDDPAAARAAIEQLLALDPDSVQAQADLLWLLLRFDDRAGLTRWVRALAPRAEPGLWSALGAALVRLDRPREALRWYGRLAGENPAEWTFWLDYAELQERVGRPDAARRLRAHGLRKVPSEAIEGRLLLGRGLLDPAERTVLARRLVADPAAPGAARRVALAVLVESRETEWASLPVRAPSTEPRTKWAEAQLSVALAVEDRSRIGQLLREEEVAPGLAAEAYAALGRYEAAATLAAAPGPDGEAARLTVRRFLAEAAKEAPSEVRARAFVLGLGGLGAVGAAGSVAIAGGDNVRFGAFTQVERYDDRPGQGLGAPVEGRVVAGARVEAGWRAGALAAELGFDAQPGGRWMPRAAVTARRRLDRLLELFAEAGAFEVVPETPLLYTRTARERLLVGVRAQLPAELLATLSVQAEHIHARGGGTVGAGGIADLRVSRPVLREPGLRMEVFGSGRVLAREAVGALPAELADLDPEVLLPTRFATVGAGIGLSTTSERLRFALELWGGWQWPLDVPAYRAEGAVGIPVFGGDELSVGGFFGNVVGGLEDVQAGAEARYRLRL